MNAAGFGDTVPCGPWAVWRYNWLANRKVIVALERVRRHAHGTLLDVGCGSRPFSSIFRGYAGRYLGLDLPSSPEAVRGLPDVYGDACRMPIRSGSVDTVLSLSMMDLIPDPRLAIAEMRRVLKPGGVLIVEFVQTAPVYQVQADLWRFTRPGVERLLADAGLVPVEIVPIGSLPAYVGLATIAALNRINRGRKRILTELPVRLAYMIIQAASELLDRLWAGSAESVAHLVVARIES